MKSRFARLGVLIASVMGLLATSTPAEATWVKSVTLVGNANLTGCAGLAYPGVNGVVPETNTTVKDGPKGVPEVNTTVKNGNTCEFGFQADCVKESVGPKKTGVDTCIILARGTVTGFCGLSSGTGTAVLINTSNTLTQKPTVTTDFKFSSTGTNLRVSDDDDDDDEWIQGDVEAIPNLASGPSGTSCTNKTATSFIIAGGVVIKDCTPGDTPIC